MAISRVDKTGRVYLPQEVRMALDITPDQPLNVNVVEGKIVLEKKRSNIAEQGRGLFKLKKHVENVDVEIRTQSLKTGIREYRAIRRR